MINEDDEVFGLNVVGVSGLVLVGVLVFLGLLCVATQNDGDCSSRACPSGRPVLIRGECVCVEDHR